MTKLVPYAIIAAGTSAFEKVEGDSEVYRKEIIYPDHFIKKTEDGEVEFELPVDDTLMDHWVAVFNKMKQSGIDVPVPIEHTSDPEASRGKMVGLKKEFNPERGTNSLYAYVKFRDPETAASLTKTSQVSLFSPPSTVDGRGVKYVRPIQHLAITDYPLVPQLGAWEKVKSGNASLALSLTNEQGSSSMKTITVTDVASRLGIEPPEGASEEEVLELIEEAWFALEDEMADEDDEDLEVDPLEEGDDEELVEDEEFLEDEEPVDVPPMEDEELDESMLEDEDLETSLISEDENDQYGGYRPDTQTPDEEEEPKGVAASLVLTLSRAREERLEALVETKKITPAQRDRLKRDFCSRKAVALSMNSGDDSFEALIKTLKMNKGLAFSTSERTSAQHDPLAEKSPMVRSAERRAANSKENS